MTLSWPICGLPAIAGIPAVPKRDRASKLIFSFVVFGNVISIQASRPGFKRYPMEKQIPVFDGHNDVLLRLYKSASSDPVADFLNGEAAGHVDL